MNMGKYFAFIVVLILASCSDQYVMEELAVEPIGLAAESEVLAPASEFNALVEKARWGDGEAYLKLADCYLNGNGVKKDFVKMIGMISFAHDYGDIASVNDYMGKLPGESEFRLFFDAICKIDEKQVEEAQILADRLVAESSPDGLVLKGILSLERGDSLEADCYFVAASEQGNELAELLLCVPDWRDGSNPNKKKLSSLADKNPVACYILANHYSGQNGEPIRDERLAAYYYLKADKMAFLDQRAAGWLLNYHRNGGDIVLTEKDVQRLKKLTGVVSEEE